METDEGPYWQRALELIEEHGDAVADFLQVNVDAVMAARDYMGILEWTRVRSAVAIILDGNGNATKQ